MPTYDYRCKNCRKSFTKFFTYNEYGKLPVACPHCGSEQVQRKIGRIRIAHAASARLEDMADPDNLDALEDNPRALGRMMRQMSEETGEDMGPEFDEVIHRLESGQSPEQIENDLPDLLGDEPAADGADFGGEDF